jgi:hypothetical protein
MLSVIVDSGQLLRTMFEVLACPTHLLFVCRHSMSQVGTFDKESGVVW